MKEGSGNGESHFVGAAWGEPGGRGAPLLGTPKEMPRKTLEKGVCFHRVTVLGNKRGRFFPRDFERRVKLIYY